MHPILPTLPVVKASEVQKNFKKVVEEVKKEGYRFVINRGNTEIVMVSVPLFQERIAASSSNEQKDDKDNKPFRDWKGKSLKQILKELRREDNKKPLDVYLKELIEWQKQFLS